MDKEFVEGNVYVFSYKKFKLERKRNIQYIKNNNIWERKRKKRYNKNNDTWAKKINGNVIYDFDGYCAKCGKNEFEVHKDWCKCIENNN